MSLRRTGVLLWKELTKGSRSFIFIMALAVPVVISLLLALLFGTFFMATDPVTTPITKRGRWIFGFGCATMILIIRYWSGLPEGVMYSILFMNALTPLINRWTRPKPFGRRKKQAEL